MTGRPPLPPHRRKHGTMYWYARHLREGTMCDLCREENKRESKKKREVKAKQRRAIKHILTEACNRNYRDYTQKELETVRRALYIVCTKAERKELGL